MKKILSISAFVLLLSSQAAHAVCPVCTVAVGAGLGLAEYFGIDDSISGVWIGALIISMSLWTINWLNAKSSTLRNSEKKSGFEELRAPASKEKAGLWKTSLKILIFLAYYAIIILPLWFKGKIGHPYNKLCGIDKLLLGIILGTVLFSAGVLFHNYIRKKNGDVSYFKGQKIVAGILPLLIASIILYFTC